MASTCPLRLVGTSWTRMVCDIPLGQDRHLPGPYAERLGVDRQTVFMSSHIFVPRFNGRSTRRGGVLVVTLSIAALPCRFEVHHFQFNTDHFRLMHVCNGECQTKLGNQTEPRGLRLRASTPHRKSTLMLRRITQQFVRESA